MRLMVLLGLLACGGDTETTQTKQDVATPAASTTVEGDTTPVKNTGKTDTTTDSNKAKKATTTPTTDAAAENTNNTKSVKEPTGE